MKRKSHYWELAEYLATRRKTKGLTQKEVSERLGYSTPQFISNFERGVAVPPLGKLANFVKILDLSTATYIDLYMRGLRRELAEKLFFRAPRKASDRYKNPE